MQERVFGLMLLFFGIAIGFVCSDGSEQMKTRMSFFRIQMSFLRELMYSILVPLCLTDTEEYVLHWLIFYNDEYALASWNQP